MPYSWGQERRGGRGLYTTRAMMKTLILESLGPGGQLLITDEIENYPGFPRGSRARNLP